MAFGLSHLVQMSEFSIKKYLIDLCLQTPCGTCWKGQRREGKSLWPLAYRTRAAPTHKFRNTMQTAQLADSSWHSPIPFVSTIRGKHFMICIFFGIIMYNVFDRLIYRYRCIHIYFLRSLLNWYLGCDYAHSHEILKG